MSQKSNCSGAQRRAMGVQTPIFFDWYWERLGNFKVSIAISTSLQHLVTTNSGEKLDSIKSK
jgi:hypothetical protein